MTTNITLYRKTNLQADKNFLFEDKAKFKTFLSRNGITTKEVQFQKIQANLSIRLQFDQDEYLKNPIGTPIALPKNLWDYCMMSHDGIDLFYFVTGANWRAENTVELSLTLDVLNSFSDRFLDSFTAKTQITRQHKDRYFGAIETEHGYNITFTIDKFPEGISPAKFLKSASPILPQGMDEDQRFYLIYSASENLSVTNITNPVDVYLSAKNRVVLEAGVTNPAKTYSAGNFEDGKAYYFLASENYYQMKIEIIDSDGTSVLYTYEYEMSSTDVCAVLYIRRAEGNTLEANLSVIDQYGQRDLYTSSLRPMIYVRFNPMKQSRVADLVLVSGSYRFYTQVDRIKEFPQIVYDAGIVSDIAIEPISDTVDRSSSKLMKIIELPYAPTSLQYVDIDDIGGVWKWNGGLLKLKNLNDEFILDGGMSVSLSQYTKRVIFGDVPSLSAPWGNVVGLEDPKLGSSQFSSIVLNYDSFSKEISLDGMKTYVNDDPYLEISFKMNNSLSSSFAFKYEIEGAPAFDEPIGENFHEYLVVNRNNELPIFSSGYIDYIRSGYNYDVKSKDTSQKQQFAGLVASGATAAITAAAASNPYLAAAVGVASLISGVTNLVINEKQSQDNIDRKLKELSMQSIGVSGATDVQIMDYYSKNKLWVMRYEPSDEVKLSLNALFHYYGYACNDFGIPNLSSRSWFNFIQCTPAFDDDCRVYLAEYITEIEERFKTGVTVFHPHEVTGLPLYDMYQVRENWENSILRIFE